MKVGLGQLDIAWENKETNKRKCEEMIYLAVNQGVELIIFPEMTLTGFSLHVSDIAEIEETSDTILFFKKMTRKYNIAIIFGYAQIKQGQAYNKMLMVQMGRIISQYTKIHSFSFSGEDKTYTSGNKLVSIPFSGINIGTFICYDLRFPEIFQASSKQNQLIIVIANWPQDRVEQWRILLKARAIENQCYMIGVNRVGEGDGLQYEGSSAVIDPTGVNVTEELKTEGLLIAEIQREVVEEYRRNFQVKQDRKIEFYRQILEQSGQAYFSSFAPQD